MPTQALKDLEAKLTRELIEFYRAQEAIEDIMADIRGGADVREAICASLYGLMLATALEAAGLPKPTPGELEPSLYLTVPALTGWQLAEAQAEPLSQGQRAVLKKLLERDPCTGPVSDANLRKDSLRSLVQRGYVRYVRNNKVYVTPEGITALEAYKSTNLNQGA